MFNRILLPVDRSPLAECVLPHAVALARAFESRLLLVHVMEAPRRGSWRRAVDPLNWRIRKTEAQSYLDELALRLKDAGVTSERQVLEGPAADQIVDLSHREEIPLVLLSSHGQSGLSGWNVSSVVQKIILRAHTSVMIVRAYEPASADISNLHYRRILLPVDGSQRAEFVLPVAATLARLHEADILLAHVVRRPEMPRQMPPTAQDVELADRLVERNQQEAARYLDGLRSRLPANAETRVIIGEHVSSTLHELVEQEHIDLVLLTAHGYSSQNRWPYGSVVSSLITYGATALLIVQDLPQHEIKPTRAEIVAERSGS
jgi:nucleotide-binding universal stress UspA family protein